MGSKEVVRSKSVVVESECETVCSAQLSFASALQVGHHSEGTSSLTSYIQQQAWAHSEPSAVAALDFAVTRRARTLAAAWAHASVVATASVDEEQGRASTPL